MGTPISRDDALFLDSCSPEHPRVPLRPKGERRVAVDRSHFVLAEPEANERNAGTSIVMIDQVYARRLSAEMAKDELTKPWKDDQAS
jgi:hypothetical protein